MASKAMRLKSGNKPMVREVSERRQVGDAEGLVNPVNASTGDDKPWWKSVGMDEGL